MKKYVYRGQMIEIDLAGYGYDGYFAEVLYQCNDAIGKSLVTMFVITKDDDGDPSLLIPVQKSQYMTGGRNEIRGNIVRVVEHMCKTKVMDNYLPDGVCS